MATISKIDLTQKWDSASYQQHAGFVSELGRGILELLNPQADERILDLGCGDGVLTQKISESGAQVTGVDASAEFVAAARGRGVDAHRMDGHQLQFENEFDAAFSNAALHWMLEPEKVVEGVARALKPGGRFVGEFGGFGNVAAVASAMRAVGENMGVGINLASPWYFPTARQYKTLLAEHGFINIKTSLFARPTPLPGGMGAWLNIMRKPFFDQFGTRSDEMLDKVVAILEPSLCDGEGNWIADYVRLRFYAERCL